MTRFFLFVVLVFSYANSFGQDLGSLLDKLQEEKSRKERVLILHELASICWEFDYEKAQEYALQAFSLANEEAYVLGQEIALSDLGLYSFYTGNYVDALEKFQQANALVNQRSNRIKYTIQIGNVFRVQAVYDSSTYYYDQALKLLKGEGSNENYADYYYNVGLQQLELMNTNIALQYLHQAAQFNFKSKDSLALAMDFLMISQAHLQTSGFDSAAFYIKAVEELDVQTMTPNLSFSVLMSEAKLYEELGQYPESIRAYERAYDGLMFHQFTRYKGIVLSGLGRVFERIGEYEMALEKYVEALEVLEKFRDRYETGRVYAQSGWAYLNQRNYQKAEEVTDRALIIFKSIHHPPRISYVYNLKGLMAFRNKEIEKSLAYYDSALIIRKGLDNPSYYYHTLNNFAQVYTQLEKYETALTFLQEAAKGEKEILDYFNLAATYNNMANLYLKLEDKKQGEFYLLLAEETAKKYKHSTQLSRTYKMLAAFYKEAKQFEKASRYFEMYSGLNDSIYDKSLQDRVDRLHAVYDLEIKEKEIESLSHQKELAEKEASNQRLVIRNQRFFIIFTATSILLLMVLSFILFRYYRVKASANRHLEQLHREVSEQKEEIQTQAEELTEANNSLFALTEKLQLANEKVQETNAELENLVQTRTHELRKAYIELDTFFYRASHDFRRPITTFLGLAEVARMTIKEQAALDLFINVRDTARSLDRMIVKLNAVSDIGSHQLVFKEVLVREIVQDVLEVFQEKINNSKIKIIDKVESNRHVLSYPALVRIIIENLIENSIDFRGPENPFIEISTASNTETLTIVVKDNGQGVDNENLDKIFEMYFRGNANSKGNGLGLYVVKKAVDKIGAQIYFESELHKGTTVTILIPLNSEA